MRSGCGSCSCPQARPQCNPVKIYNSNPWPADALVASPCRWRGSSSNAKVVTTRPQTTAHGVSPEIRPLAAPGENVVLVAGTMDTKGEELRYMRDLIRAAGLPVRMVDLSTSSAVIQVRKSRRTR
jgi:hypothetical protein